MRLTCEDTPPPKVVVSLGSSVGERWVSASNQRAATESGRAAGAGRGDESRRTATPNANNVKKKQKKNKKTNNKQKVQKEQPLSCMRVAW